MDSWYRSKLYIHMGHLQNSIAPKWNIYFLAVAHILLQRHWPTDDNPQCPPWPCGGLGRWFPSAQSLGPSLSSWCRIDQHGEMGVFLTLLLFDLSLLIVLWKENGALNSYCQILDRKRSEKYQNRRKFHQPPGKQIMKISELKSSRKLEPKRSRNILIRGETKRHS